MPDRNASSVSARTVLDKVSIVTDTHLIQRDDRAVA